MTRALTLTQPWAELVASGQKRVETRSWRSWWRGPILIHAAAGMPGYAKDAARHFNLQPGRLERGAIVARATIVDVVRVEAIRLHLGLLELEAGDYSDGRFAWILGGVERIDPPIAWRGALGLWAGPEL